MTFLGIPVRDLVVGSQTFRYVDIRAIAGEQVCSLPVVLRLLLENVARCAPADAANQAVGDILDWLKTGHSTAEIEFQPARVLMHDTTSTPALVDVAAMRDALQESGVDPTVLSPTLPIDVSIDHSLAVQAHGTSDASERNLSLELRLNAERYRFLRWAGEAFDSVRIHPPGTGIMHTINLEQLATVVTQDTSDASLLIPDTMIGTDSHTPMINSIGVLGWGVGGLEAQTVMFGMPTRMRIPDVLGIRLLGQLQPGVTATDLALTLTHAIRQRQADDCFVEFFGTGVSTLSVGQRGVVANMAPEFGVTTAYFPVDDQTLTYLRQTGRPEYLLQQIKAYTSVQSLWFDPMASPRYTDTLTIDLAQIEPTISGPTRPQDALPLTALSVALRQARPKLHAVRSGLPEFPIAIAAITSCTNTTDPALLIAAGLVARNARRLGLKPASWVKTSLSPGSPAALNYLERAGLLDDLEAVGFSIVGYGCATCIGNSGHLLPEITALLGRAAGEPVAVLSGNRNFPGRVHPDLRLGFLMSPALVVAMALAGHADLNPLVDAIGVDVNEQPVYLSDIWPSDETVAQALKIALKPSDFKEAFDKASLNPLWYAIKPPAGDCFAWDASSTILRRPPFADVNQGSLLGRYAAYPLLTLGDDVTTDHISPASAIPVDSAVAAFLTRKGEKPDELNVFASRRGNWEVMVRGAFHSKTLVNHLCPTAGVGKTIHQPDGQIESLWEVAQRYEAESQSVVIVAGERYGMGSSRDWAAKNLRLLGVRAVLAASFERIHRTNLIGMGVLPIRLEPQHASLGTELQVGDRLLIDASIDAVGIRQPIEVRLMSADGQSNQLSATIAVETQLELELLRAGGVIPRILRQHLS